MERNITFDELWDNLKSQNEGSKDFYGVAETISDIIGDIARARVSRGWTQRDLAQACGVKQSAIARMERYQVIPRLDTVAKIAQKLNLKICARPMLSEVNGSKSYVISATASSGVYRNCNLNVATIHNLAAGGTGQ